MPPSFSHEPAPTSSLSACGIQACGVTSSAPSALPRTDKLVHWLLNSLQLDATLFHVGQYCGRWKASTAGKATASFHLVLHGECWLHFEDGSPSVHLRARDGVFLLRDIPHFLSPSPDPQATVARIPMQGLGAEKIDSTGLACGFFEFHGALSQMLVHAFPSCVLLHPGEPKLHAIAPLFDMILQKAQSQCPHPDSPSPLIERLTHVLFFYVILHVAENEDVPAGLWAMARHPHFADLLAHMLDEPGANWSLERMADWVHMSRASFCRHFLEVSGETPAQFVLNLRMRIAAQRLNRGDSIDRTAEHVGYQSYAAFSRAFKKAMGTQPGVWRRLSQQRDEDSESEMRHTV